MVATLFKTARQHTDDMTVEFIVAGFGLFKTRQAQPFNAASERMKHGQVLVGRHMLHLDRKHPGQARADINRLGEIIECLAIDNQRPGETDFTFFLQRVLDGGKEIIVPGEVCGPLRQQVQLVVVRVGDHEHRGVHIRQQGAGGDAA